MGIKGTVFNIQRFSVHDGPGIRTTVFLKGCTNKCFWCHNPEGLRREIEPEFDVRRCMGCGTCALACPSSALRVEAGKVQYDKAKCTYCLACTKACVTGACTSSARELAVEEVMEEVMEDRNAYRDSGGGVTVSGGEPLVQAEFCGGILERAKDQGVHTAIETAGNVPWKAFGAVLPYVDLVLMDLKHLDDNVHRRVTGVSNRVILANASRLAAAKGSFQLRFRGPCRARCERRRGRADQNRDIREGTGDGRAHPHPISFVGGVQVRTSRFGLPRREARDGDAGEAGAVTSGRGLFVYIASSDRKKGAVG